MHNIKILALVALLVLAGAFTAKRAEAIPLQGAPAIGITAKEDSLRRDVTYACRRIWRCGPWGCGWRRVCRPGFAYPYLYPYRYYYGWRGYYRPYWRGYPRYWARPYWRGRTWRGRRYWR